MDLLGLEVEHGLEALDLGLDGLQLVVGRGEAGVALTLDLGEDLGLLDLDLGLEGVDALLQGLFALAPFLLLLALRLT